MSLSDTTNIILTALPFLLMIAGLLYKLGAGWVEKRLPDNLVPVLQDLAQIAVLQVEQQGESWSSGQKKLAAIKTVKDLFVAMHLAPPSDDAISAAIEAAVFLLHQGQPPAPQTQHVPSFPSPRLG